MKPITERRRQELIDDCVAEIERLNRRLSTYGEQWRTYIESQLERQKVALASLTAEPFVYVNAVTVRNGVVASLVANGVGLYDGNLPVELYPAPPVPVIKLPEYQKLLTHPAVKTRWNECIDEVKRLNGLGE